MPADQCFGLADFHGVAGRGDPNGDFAALQCRVAVLVVEGHVPAAGTARCRLERGDRFGFAYGDAVGHCEYREIGQWFAVDGEVAFVEVEASDPLMVGEH